jgi:hypothetical protein
MQAHVLNAFGGMVVSANIIRKLAHDREAISKRYHRFVLVKAELNEVFVAPFQISMLLQFGVTQNAFTTEILMKT